MNDYCEAKKTFIFMDSFPLVKEMISKITWSIFKAEEFRGEKNEANAHQDMTFRTLYLSLKALYHLLG